MYAKRPDRLGIASDQGGATALEFALVLPIFLTVMFGVFEFGWAQHKLSTIRFAMETASRRLMLDPTVTESQISALVKNAIGDTGDKNVNITMVVNDSAGGKVAQVTGAYTTNIGVPGLPTYPIQWTTTVSTALPPG